MDVPKVAQFNEMNTRGWYCHKTFIVLLSIQISRTSMLL